MKITKKTYEIIKKRDKRRKSKEKGGKIVKTREKLC